MATDVWTRAARARLSAAAILAVVCLLSCVSLSAQRGTPRLPESGHRYARLAIRNAIVVDGTGIPARGPMDIIVENGRIVAIVPLDAVAAGRSGRNRLPADVEIDATGKYVLPGLIDVHAHLQDERAGEPQPIEYETKMWLACGITTVRDVGSDLKKSLVWREQSKNGTLAAPRLILYPMLNAAPMPQNGEQARARVREYKQQGADGLKMLDVNREVMAAAEDEAHKLGLRVAHHAGVEETNAWDDIKFGTTSIEHWYGIPDAAIPDGVQNFPSSYNYNNETDRFRWAGHLWREADHDRLMNVFDAMIAAHVAWVPTLDIYEASRDLQRAQTQPWFAEYLHPTLEDYFRPDPSRHGSYFFGWTSTDETFWKENYRIWDDALREFERRGGLIGSGDDAGFIYQMYGFGLIRELELEQEAGFNTLKILQHVTSNNAKILGMDDQLGKVRTGYIADLIVVDGNPLENLKVLYPTGIDEIRNGKAMHTGGVEWTVKDGIPYSGPAMLADVKSIVAQARAERARQKKQP